MGKIIEFPGAVEPEDLLDIDLDELDREKLEELLVQVEERLEELDDNEPLDFEDEEYEAWGEEHEDLEDLADEIRDRLEEME